MSHVTPGRRTLICAALVLAAGLLAGCADPTGSNALTARNYTSADGVQADSALITVRDFLLISDGRGATVVGAFGNNGNSADSVVAIAAEGANATVDADGGSLQIPSGGALTFGAATPPGGPQAFLTGTFAPGSDVGVQITFASAQALDLRVPVLPRSGYYTAVPAPTPTPVTTPDTAPIAVPSTTAATPASSPAPVPASVSPTPSTPGAVATGAPSSVAHTPVTTAKPTPSATR